MQQEQINLRKYYEPNGYVVMPGLITTDQVESLLKAYREQIVLSKAKFFRQNTNVYETNRFTSGGYVAQSFLDIHNYKKFPEFRKSAFDIYFPNQMLHSLSDLIGSCRYNLTGHAQRSIPSSMGGSKAPLLSDRPEKRAIQGEMNYSERNSLVEGLCGNSPEIGEIRVI